MELKKLLMSSGKEDACGQLGSPKVEGTGKKGVAGQPQVRGRKLLPQCPGGRCLAPVAAFGGSELTASCCSQLHYLEVLAVGWLIHWMLGPTFHPPGASTAQPSLCL